MKQTKTTDKQNINIAAIAADTNQPIHVSISIYLILMLENEAMKQSLEQEYIVSL